MGRPRRGMIFPVESDLKQALSKPQGLSVGRAWKFRRNLVIYIASQHGCSQRLLADVFDLPHSRIAAIIKEFRARMEDKIP